MTLTAGRSIPYNLAPVVNESKRFPLTKHMHCHQESHRHSVSNVLDINIVNHYQASRIATNSQHGHETETKSDFSNCHFNRHSRPITKRVLQTRGILNKHELVLFTQLTDRRLHSQFAPSLTKIFNSCFKPVQCFLSFLLEGSYNEYNEKCMAATVVI